MSRRGTEKVNDAMVHLHLFYTMLDLALLRICINDNSTEQHFNDVSQSVNGNGRELGGIE